VSYCYPSTFASILFNPSWQLNWENEEAKKDYETETKKKRTSVAEIIKLTCGHEFLGSFECLGNKFLRNSIAGLLRLLRSFDLGQQQGPAAVREPLRIDDGTRRILENLQKELYEVHVISVNS